MGIGEIIYGKIGGDFILKFFMDFVENGLILLGNFFGIFWIRGVLKFQTKNLAGNSRTQ